MVIEVINELSAPQIAGLILLFILCTYGALRFIFSPITEKLSSIENVISEQNAVLRSIKMTMDQKEELT